MPVLEEDYKVFAKWLAGDGAKEVIAPRTFEQCVLDNETYTPLSEKLKDMEKRLSDTEVNLKGITAELNKVKLVITTNLLPNRDELVGKEIRVVGRNGDAYSAMVSSDFVNVIMLNLPSLYDVTIDGIKDEVWEVNVTNYDNYYLPIGSEDILWKGSMEETSWASLRKIIDAGRAKKFLKIGDKKSVYLEPLDETMYFQVAGFDLYEPNTVTLLAENCLNYNMKWAIDNTVGGFKASDICTWLNEDFLAMLPEDLQEIIKVKKMWRGAGNTTTTTQFQIEETKVWLPTAFEMFGTSQTSGYQEWNYGHKMFPLFMFNSRIKFRNVLNLPIWYWLATMPTENNYQTLYAQHINTNGDLTRTNVYNVTTGEARTDGGILPGIEI